ncbi:MAG: JmjC domain-containing protein, partial [Actinomycetes bacterium]
VEARAEEPPLLEPVLRPGDALYLPRGYLHSAEALGEVACHLTVGVHPVTREAVLDSLVAVVMDGPALRSSLPLGIDVGNPSDVQPELKATVDALMERLRAVTAAEVASYLGTRLAGSNRPAPLGPLAQVAALETLSPDSVLVARRAQRLVVSTEGERLLLRLADRTVSMPLGWAKAVRELLDGDRIRVGDLPGLDGDEPIVLARRLVREAVVVVDSAT